MHDCAHCLQLCIRVCMYEATHMYCIVVESVSILIYKIGLKTLNNGSHSQSTTENTPPTIKRDKATSQAVQLSNCSFDCSRGALLSNGRPSLSNSVNIYQFLSLDVVSFSYSSSLGGGTGPSSFSLSSSSSSSLALFLFSSLALSNLDLN